jgi:glycosyltransferase involved in cell wall biosynthesis
MKLSIVIPAYNERNTIGKVLIAVSLALPEVEKEIIVVDDCSKDGTREWLRSNVAAAQGRYGGIAAGGQGGLQLTPASAGEEGGCTLRALFHEKNQGKGAALRTGFAGATGEIIVIQDADLEYDPQDWQRMYRLIAELKVADVVYGSRFYGEPHRALYFHHYMANRLISFLFNLLYDQTLTDIEVCYKMFTREVLQSLRLSCNDFGFEIQISAQIARARKWRIYEMGISYFGRTYMEGKKINWKDGVKALWYLVKFRVM